MSDAFLLANNINSAVRLCLGWPANLLLIWLIRNKTRQTMQVWSRVLLQAALIDLLLISETFLVQPILNVEGKMLFGFLIGPFAHLSLPIALVLLYYLHMFCAEFAKYAMAIQYIYRWLVICRDRKLSIRQYTQLLAIPAAMAFVLFTIRLLNWANNNNPNAHCSRCPIDRIVMLAFLTNTTTLTLMNSLMLFFTITTYVVIALTTLHIWLRSRHTLMVQQQQSREIRRQVGYVLLVQALLPLAFSLMPSAILFFETIFGLQHRELLGLFFIQYWSSVCDPLITILIVGPYRKWLCGLFRCIFSGERSAVIYPTVVSHHSNGVHQQQQSSTTPIQIIRISSNACVTAQ